MMLNSFGGKFEKQPSKSQVQTFKSFTKFYKLLQVKEQDTQSELWMMNWLKLYTAIAINPLPHKWTLIFCGVFSTRWAHLNTMKPWNTWDNKWRTLTWTQSFTIGNRPHPNYLLGKYLGQFTNELDDPDYHITEFAAAGPKKLRLQNSPRKDAIQSLKIQPQHLRKTTIKFCHFGKHSWNQESSTRSQQHPCL